MKRPSCVVCCRPTARGILCRPCGRSYDRDRDRDMTILACIAWAARRARRFALENARRVRP